MIGRYGWPEEYQAGIAIAFLHVTEHLVVSAILLDDVDHMLKGRIRVCRPTLSNIPPDKRSNRRVSSTLRHPA
jgi:hypothetical protein